MSLSIARSYRRILAYLVDSIITMILFTPIWIQMLASLFRDRTFEIDFNLLILCFLLNFFYHFLFLRFMGGTIGKLLFGLRVVNKSNGGSPSSMQCFLRVLTDQLGIFFGNAPRVLAFARFDRTHVSDWVAETQVRQTSPREDHPKRNIPVTLVVALYLAYSSFISAYQWIQRSEFDHGKMIVHPLAKESDLSSSGH